MITLKQVEEIESHGIDFIEIKRIVYPKYGNVVDAGMEYIVKVPNTRGKNTLWKDVGTAVSKSMTNADVKNKINYYLKSDVKTGSLPTHYYVVLHRGDREFGLNEIVYGLKGKVTKPTTRKTCVRKTTQTKKLKR